jgi:hypothetical protein
MFRILLLLPGYPNLDFFNAMEAEHCRKSGFDMEFTSGNYQITTSPQKEWMFVVGKCGKSGKMPGHNMEHGRKHLNIESALNLKVSKRAGLTKAVVVAVILYTGPMVSVAMPYFVGV